MPSRLRLLRPLLTAALLLAHVGESAAAARPGKPQAQTETQRLEELGRIWIYVDLFDPYLNAAANEWDQALLEAIPAVRTARDEAAYIAALNAMLARSGDPAARVVAKDTPARPLPQPVRKERGAWIADCNAMVQAVATGAAPMQLAANVAAQPAIVDCRSFTGDRAALQGVVAAIARTRSTAPLPAGSALVRSYNGFPSEVSPSPANLAAGFALRSKGTLAAGTGTPSKAPLVFLLDPSAAPALPQIAALQSAGLARVVSAGPIGSGLTTLRLARTTIEISEGLYTYPAGAVGFRPDATATSDKALATAIAQLTAAPTAILREPALPPLQRPPRRYKNTDVPTAEQRLLALFRVWGTVNHFHPYKSLMDRPWENVLGEFVPVMLAANTRAAYETALLRLAARTQDSHTQLDGLTAPPLGFEKGQPAIRVRYVQNRLAVVEISDKTLAPGIGVGDTIVAVDGIPIAQLEQRLTPLIAASTPQALRAGLAARLLAGPTGSIAALGVRGPTGPTRTVRLQRAAGKVAAPQPWRTLAGDIGYIDLAHLKREDANRTLDELRASKALILDLRGPTQGAAWVLGPRLAQSPAPFRIALVRRPSYQGPPKPGALEAAWLRLEDAQRPAPAGRYAGRVFALIDERTTSQSEHAALMFEAAANVTFVGSLTSGTNGDVTALQIPGGLTLRLSAHDVAHPNGARLQRVGIPPDVAVSPTLKGLRTGRDEVLDKALDLARR
jgi:Peptidase family S41